MLKEISTYQESPKPKELPKTTITTNSRSGNGNAEVSQGSTVPREGSNDEFELMKSDTANVANPQGNAEQDENFQVGEDVDIREPGSGATAPELLLFHQPMILQSQQNMRKLVKMLLPMKM